MVRLAVTASDIEPEPRRLSQDLLGDVDVHSALSSLRDVDAGCGSLRAATAVS